MTHIHRIVYCSRNVITGDADTRDRQITQILDASRQNNSKADITGALLFSSDHFAQVLEGPQTSIEKTFERIQRDSRHGDVTVLESAPCANREFSLWSMAYVKVTPGASDTAMEARLQEALLHNNAAGQDVVDLLKTLVNPED